MKAIDFLLDLIWPNRCPFCGELIPWDEPYCDKCYSELKRVGNRNCKFCGMSECICKFNKGKRIFPHYEKCYSAVIYEKGARNMVLSMKLGNMKFYAKLAAGIINDFCDMEIEKDCVFIGVPMRKSDIIKRGYNQSELIAKELAKLNEAPYCKGAMKKLRKTKQQKTLTAKQRAVNLHNAFGVEKTEAVKDKDVVICDDVITTGATLNECARMLKRAGAKSVTAVSFAVTGFYKDSY